MCVYSRNLILDLVLDAETSESPGYRPIELSWPRDFDLHHYAFKVSEEEFDEIFTRLKSEDPVYGSSPRTPDDGEINNWNGGRGVYFRDPNGHLLELLTRDYTAEQFQSG